MEGEGVLSTSQAVLQHLPSLRRYARALTGSQASGDAYVVATVESLIASPKILESGSNSRVALYRLFTKIWNSVAVNGKAEAGEVVLPPEQHLTQITPRPRQAFLLVALEGFSEEDAAEVLDCDLPTLRALVEESGRELAAEIATDVLIIEDETFIAMDIEALVESLGHNVIGIARTHSEALALAKQKRPGLILADIQLADGSSGLDAVNELLGSFEVPVIFITAYPERFLTGQRPEPAFLIAKPFQVAVVSAVVSQALFFGRKARQRERKPAERQATLVVFEILARDAKWPGRVPAIFLFGSRRRIASQSGIARLKNVRAKSLGRSRSAYRLRPTWPAKHGGRGEEWPSAIISMDRQVCSSRYACRRAVKIPRVKVPGHEDLRSRSGA